MALMPDGGVDREPVMHEVWNRQTLSRGRARPLGFSFRIAVDLMMIGRNTGSRRSAGPRDHSPPAELPALGMARPPSRGRLPGPAVEGPREGARFRVPQHDRDLVQGQLGVGQQVTGDRKPDLVDNLLECDALAGQVPAQGTVVHREQAGDLDRGARSLQQLGLEHPAQIHAEAARSVARPRLGVDIAS